jgi:hypothetical protein
VSSTRPGPIARSGPHSVNEPCSGSWSDAPADRDPDLARLHHPVPGPAGERGPVGVQPEGDLARLAGLERDPDEAGQPAGRPDDLGHRVAQVQLDDGQVPRPPRRRARPPPRPHPARARRRARTRNGPGRALRSRRRSRSARRGVRLAARRGRWRRAGPRPPRGTVRRGDGACFDYQLAPAGELPAKGQDHPAGQQPKGVSSRWLRQEFPDLRQALDWLLLVAELVCPGGGRSFTLVPLGGLLGASQLHRCFYREPAGSSGVYSLAICRYDRQN